MFDLLVSPLWWEEGERRDRLVTFALRPSFLGFSADTCHVELNNSFGSGSPFNQVIKASLINKYLDIIVRVLTRRGDSAAARQSR